MVSSDAGGKKKKYRFLIDIGLVLFFLSLMLLCNKYCKNCVLEDFTREEYQWLLYNNYDTISFVSEDGDTRRFVASQKRLDSLKTCTKCETIGFQFLIELGGIQSYDYSTVISKNSDHQFEGVVSFGGLQVILGQESPHFKDRVEFGDRKYLNAYLSEKIEQPKEGDIIQFAFDGKKGVTHFETQEANGLMRSWYLE